MTTVPQHWFATKRVIASMALAFCSIDSVHADAASLPVAQQPSQAAERWAKGRRVVVASRAEPLPFTERTQDHCLGHEGSVFLPSGLQLGGVVSGAAEGGGLTRNERSGSPKGGSTLT